MTAVILASALSGCSGGKGRAGSDQSAAEQALTTNSAVLEKKAKGQALRQWPEILTAEATCKVRDRRVQIVSEGRAAFSVAFQCSVTPRPADGKERPVETTVSGELEYTDSGWILGSFF